MSIEAFQMVSLPKSLLLVLSFVGDPVKKQESISEEQYIPCSHL